MTELYLGSLGLASSIDAGQAIMRLDDVVGEVVFDAEGTRARDQQDEYGPKATMLTDLQGNVRK